MSHLLKNNSVEIQIDGPMENYNFSRFDWTGKITQVKFEGISIGTSERLNDNSPNSVGKGFYNEFGIDMALGFEETPIGDWFHKIGVGLLRKPRKTYHFMTSYEIQPAQFKFVKNGEMVEIHCKSQHFNGYSYLLKKTIALQDDGFTLHYHLQNTGENMINTTEYNHNFMAIDHDGVGPNYRLCFPFRLDPKVFDEVVNLENNLIVKQNEFQFKGMVKEQFFFGNLTGDRPEQAHWELINEEKRIGVRETASFTTEKVNLWGWNHVISPELFHKISLKPSQSAEWSRTYTIFRLP